MDLNQLTINIGKYLKLNDPFIIKLLSAAIIANRCPDLESTWIFIISSSSGGKSELLLAMAYSLGCMQKDDLTPRTFISGAQGSDGKEKSLINNLLPNCVLVVKDLTVLLNKDDRDSKEIFSQLRMIYDGTFNKSFGTGQTIETKPRMGLIAGVTGVIEDFQADDAAVGQRAIKYNMTQPGDDGLDELTAEIIGGKADREMRVMIGESWREFLDGNKWDYNNIPELPLEIRLELSALSNMATRARSFIKRKKYDRNNRIERIDEREMPFRFAKQLANLAKAIMIMNNGPLEADDKAALFKICLDSIPKSRKEVMMAATKYTGGVTLDGLAIEMGIDTESAKIHVYDLIAMKIMTGNRGINNKFIYLLNDKYKGLLAKYEHLQITNKILEGNEEEPEVKSWEEIGMEV